MTVKFLLFKLLDFFTVCFFFFWLLCFCQTFRGLVTKSPSLLFRRSCGIRFVDFPGGLDGQESACNAGDPSSIPGSGRSPGEGHANPLQYFLPGKSRGQKRLVGYSPQSCKRVGHDLATKQGNSCHLP